MEASVYIATSVDGFIAREDGSIEWLSVGGESAAGEDYGYQEFMGSVDAIVMGRNTYDIVLSFDSWPYGEKPMIVLSSRSVDIHAGIASTVESMNASPQEVVRRLSERGFHHLYVDGGTTIQGFLREGLITRLTITRIPILLGSGIPLFGPLPHDVRLIHIETRSFDNGFVQSKYEVHGTGPNKSV